MKLYIKQRVFSWSDKFAVKDETETDRWFAQGEIFSLTQRLHVFDANNVEQATIHRKLVSLLPRYYIETGGAEYEFAGQLAFFKQKYTIEQLGWTIEGNFMAHDYTIDSGMGAIMSMKKAWFTWGDSYELDIADPKNELMCLCAALAIDCVHSSSKGSGLAGLGTFANN